MPVTPPAAGCGAGSISLVVSAAGAVPFDRDVEGSFVVAQELVAVRARPQVGAGFEIVYVQAEWVFNR